MRHYGTLLELKESYMYGKHKEAEQNAYWQGYQQGKKSKKSK